MQKIKSNVLFRLVFFALLTYGIHKLVFRFFFPEASKGFIYPIEQLYLVFGAVSLFICTILLFIRKSEINNVGFSFLLLTFAKMGIAAYFIQPVLRTGAAHQVIEKYNFFAVFVVFLSIETLTTIGILNKKQ